MASRKGSPNKIGAQVKDNVVAVFNRLGGTAKMAEWAQDNLSEFYRLYARLIPTEVLATVDLRDATELSDGELAAIASGGSAGTDQAPSGEAQSGSVH